MRFQRHDDNKILKIIAIAIPIALCVWCVVFIHSQYSKNNDNVSINTQISASEKIKDETESLIVTPSTQQETLTSDDQTASQIIAEYLNSTGIYKVIKKSESQWEKTDLSQYAEQDSRALNLYRYYSFGRYAKDYDDENGKHHRLGDYAEFYCYVTKDENEKYYVHYISKMGVIIYDDGFMTDELLKIVNGDTMEESGAFEQQSYD